MIGEKVVHVGQCGGVVWIHGLCAVDDDYEGRYCSEKEGEYNVIDLGESKALLAMLLRIMLLFGCCWAEK